MPSTPSPSAGDVLDSGEPVRWSRGRRLLAAGAVVVAAAAAAGWQLVQERDAQRRAAAAVAAEDRVGLRGTLTGPLQPSGRALTRALVRVEADGPAPRGRLTGVELVGPGLTPVDYPQPAFSGLPLDVEPLAAVDCGRVAEQPLTEASVVLTVLPASRRPQQQRVAVPPEQVREALLSACELPDPDARPVAQVSGLGDRLLVFLDAVPRSTATLRLEAVDVPGVEVDVASQPPVVLPPGSGGVVGFPVAITDCALVRPGEAPVRVRLTEDDQPVTVEAGPSSAQPQPDAVTVEQLLSRLVEEQCP